MKYLLLLLAIFTLSVLLVISHALTKDIIDNTTGKKVPDREGKRGKEGNECVRDLPSSYQ